MMWAATQVAPSRCFLIDASVGSVDAKSHQCIECFQKDSEATTHLQSLIRLDLQRWWVDTGDILCSEQAVCMDEASDDFFTQVKSCFSLTPCCCSLYASSIIIFLYLLFLLVDENWKLIRTLWITSSQNQLFFCRIPSICRLFMYLIRVRMIICALLQMYKQGSHFSCN